MNRITVSKSDCKQETTSAWLASILQFCIEGRLLAPLKAFKLNMKEVRYTIYQKLLTVMASIMMGCESTKDINEVLVPETLAANMLGMDRFPDQSQINAFLKRMDSDSITQLKDIHHQLFMEYSQSLSSSEDIVVDIDQSGLVANSKSYEFSDKGYFPHKRGKRGYQVSAAFTGKHAETVDFYFDPGNTHCQDRLKDLLDSTILKYQDNLMSGKLIIRADSGYGAYDNICMLNDIKGLKFIVKGYSSKKAASIASTVSFGNYTQVDEGAWVFELPELEEGLRAILVQVLGKKGDLAYSLLYTNIDRDKLSAVEAFHFYNGRQTIEAFFKMAKNTYNIKSLRTGKFYGTYGFIWLVFITHNLITWFKSTALKDTELEDIGVRVLVEKCSRVRGFVERTSYGIKVVIQPLTKLAKLLAEALSQPQYVQLSFLT
jgi:hypothetical protein